MTRKISPPWTELAQLRTPLTEGEWRVLRYFDEVLPPSWEIYVQPHLNGLRPDFVLLNPKNGIAVFEVKDWDLSAMDYFTRAGAHASPRLMARRDGKEFSIEKQNPVAKIDAYKREIHGLYCPSLSANAGLGAIVAGLIFPNASTQDVSNLLNPLREHAGHLKHPKLYPIVGADLLLNRNRSVVKRNVLPSLEGASDRMNSAAADDLRRWLVEPEFSAEQRRPLSLELNTKQREICLNPSGVKFRRVRGPAGSGKSLVLAGRAAQLAMEGRRVLLVTFNITLVNYLLDLSVRYAQNGKVRSQIEAMNFHYWCRRVASMTGNTDAYAKLWKDANHGDVLDESLADSAKHWAEQLDAEERWDAILVDEGQDFRLSWWRALRSALATERKGEAMLCADRFQNIYGVTPWTEDEMKGTGFRGRWMTLETSYRLPQKLCDLAASFVDKFLPGGDDPRPAQSELQLAPVPVLKWIEVSAQSAAEACVRALLEIVESPCAEQSYADLVCIVDDDVTGSAIVRLLREIGIGAIHTFGTGSSEQEKHDNSRRKKLAFFKGDSRVKVTTIQSYKGWEATSLVVSLSHASSADSLSLGYTGITRLKAADRQSFLTVVCSAPELREYGMAWPR